MKSHDFSKKTNYTERQMFLDPAGPVTVQRFDDVRYPKIQKYEQIARGYFWVPEEISLTQDKKDYRDSSEAIQFMYTQNTLRLTSLDSLQGRAPTQVFTPVCSIPELEALVSNWSFFETNIHSNSYSHIIRNIYAMPKEQFDTIHENEHIVKMAANVGRYYDALHMLNIRKELGEKVSEKEHIKAIWLALHASYALECLRFYTGFCTFFAFVENKIFMGNGNIIGLILQDELLHTEWTAYIINRVVKDDPRFAAAKEECADEVYQIYMEVIREEKDWAEHLFSKGVVLGLNAAILKQFVDYTATYRLKDIGIKYLENPIKVNPVPWFDKHANVSTKQTALQEQESTSYVIGAVSSTIDLDELPSI